MPQVTVYIRKKDLEKWKQIGAKSQLIADALSSVNIEAYNKAVGERQEIKKMIKPYLKQMKKKSVPQAEEPKEVPFVAIGNGEYIPKPLRKIVDACPHGYAKGFCKKADCNRKYK